MDVFVYLKGGIVMEINVVVFGSDDLAKLVIDIGSKFEDLKMLKAVYCHPNQVIDLIDKHQDKGDILLFVAPFPYLIARDYLNRHEMELNKPMIFVPYTELSIYGGLFRTIKKIGLDPHTPISFSIDTLPESEVMECLEELEMDIGEVFTKECNFDQNIDDLVSFHVNLWNQGKILVAMTTYYVVHQKLQELGIPAYRLVPAKSTIRNTLQRVFLEGKSLHQAESQIAIGIIGFQEIRDSDKRTISEYQMKRRKLAIQQMLIDYGEEIQALIDWSDNGEIRFITTRGEIERNTTFFQNISILQDIQNKLNMSTFLGIGFGLTANEAEIKAYEALSKAKSCGDGSCFVMELNGKVQGPIGKPSHLKYSIRSNDPELLSMAKKSGLSIGTINKLISFSESFGSTKMTAFDLASGFGITLRSARRILSKLEQYNFARIIGEEQPISKGRPRQIYKLSIKNNL